MRQGLSQPAFRQYVGTVNYHWPAPRTEEQRKKHEAGSYPIYSHIKMLPGEGNTYPGFIGGKNGYTVHSYQTFVGAAQRNYKMGVPMVSSYVIGVELDRSFEFLFCTGPVPIEIHHYSPLCTMGFSQSSVDLNGLRRRCA